MNNDDDCFCHYILPVLGALIGLLLAYLAGTRIVRAIKCKLRASKERAAELKRERERAEKEAAHQKKIDEANDSLYRGKR